LKAHIEKPALSDQLHFAHHERIEDAPSRRAVDLVDRGDAAGLRALLDQHRELVDQRVTFEGGNYFRNPTLLELVAENPVRRGILPDNIVEVARVILDAGAEPSAWNQTLMLVSTGSVPRQCGMQVRLTDLLCEYGADPNSALHAAAVHGELEALRALIGRGGRIDLPVAAALGRIEQASRLLPGSNGEDRQLGIRLGRAVWSCRDGSTVARRGPKSQSLQPGRGPFPYDAPASGRWRRAIANASDYWWNAVRDSIGRIYCGRLLRPTGRDTQAGQQSRPSRRQVGSDQVVDREKKQITQGINNASFIGGDPTAMNATLSPRPAHPPPD